MVILTKGELNIVYGQVPFLFLPSNFNFSDGKFGEYMQVHIQNDGPVTIELESPTAPVDSKQVCCSSAFLYLSILR